MYCSDAMALAPSPTASAISRGRRLGGDLEGLRHRLQNDGRRVNREVKQTAKLSGAVIGKGNHRHFMMKEIAEQPTVIGDTPAGLLNPLQRRIELPAMPLDLAKVSGDHRRLRHAPISRLRGEILAGADRAPSGRNRRRLGFRYRAAPMDANRVTIVISQSGRNGGYPGCPALCEVAGPEDHRRAECPGKHHEPRGRRHAANAGRPRNRRRLDQGLHHTVDRIGLPHPRRGIGRGTIDAKREAELSTALTGVPARAAEVLNHDAS